MQIKYILAGIDGTNSREWTQEKQGSWGDIPVFTNSHVNRFVQEFNTSPELKKGKSPLAFINRKARFAVYIPVYFCKDKKNNSLIPIR